MIESPPQTLPVGTKPYGDKVARVTEGTQISFVELEARSNQPANALVSIIRDNLDGPLRYLLFALTHRGPCPGS